MYFEIKLKNYSLLSISSYLMCLLPIALVTGSFLSDLIISLIALFFLYISIKNKEWQYYKNFFFYIFIFFSFFLFIRSLFTIDIILSFESSLFYFRFIFFSLGIAYLINNYKGFLEKFSNYLLFTMLIIIADSYLQLFTGKNIFGYNHGLRISSFFDESFILGVYLSKLIPIYFCLISINQKIDNKKFIVAMIFLVLADVIVLVSGDRSAFFLLTLSTLIIIVFTKRYKLIRLFTFLFAIVIISVILNTNDSVKERIVDNTVQQTGIFEEKKYFFSENHEAMLVSSYRMFIDNPIFGQGPKMYRVLCSDIKFEYPGSCQTHPHNTYLQLAAETGIIGILTISIFVFIFLRTMLRQAYSLYVNNKSYIEDYQVCLLSAFSMTLWPLVPAMNVFGNWISILYFLPLGFFLADKENMIIK